MNHEKWLSYTVKLAVEYAEKGGDPFAAVIVREDVIISSGTNRVESTLDPSAHAELLAIKEACTTLQTTDLSDCILYASGEPCAMCLGAAYWSSVGEIYFACSKQDAFEAVGFTDPLKNFFTDQLRPAWERSVPFIQKKTEHAVEPFKVWQKQKKS